jgi:hypothetical protein
MGRPRPRARDPALDGAPGLPAARRGGARIAGRWTVSGCDPIDGAGHGPVVVRSAPRQDAQSRP